MVRQIHDVSLNNFKYGKRGDKLEWLIDMIDRGIPIDYSYHTKHNGVPVWEGGDVGNQLVKLLPDDGPGGGVTEVLGSGEAFTISKKQLDGIIRAGRNKRKKYVLNLIADKTSRVNKEKIASREGHLQMASELMNEGIDLRTLSDKMSKLRGKGTLEDLDFFTDEEKAAITKVLTTTAVELHNKRNINSKVRLGGEIDKKVFDYSLTNEEYENIIPKITEVGYHKARSRGPYVFGLVFKKDAMQILDKMYNTSGGF